MSPCLPTAAYERRQGLETASGTTLNLHVEPQYSVYADKTGAPRWQILAGLIMQF